MKKRIMAMALVIMMLLAMIPSKVVFADDGQDDLVVSSDDSAQGGANHSGIIRFMLSIEGNSNLWLINAENVRLAYEIYQIDENGEKLVLDSQSVRSIVMASYSVHVEESYYETETHIAYTISADGYRTIEKDLLLTDQVFQINENLEVLTYKATINARLDNGAYSSEAGSVSIGRLRTGGFVYQDGAANQEYVFSPGSVNELVVEANSGYCIASVAIDGNSVTLDENTRVNYRCDLPEADVNIDIVFARVFEVSVQVNGNGGTHSVDENSTTIIHGSVYVQEGRTTAVYAIPDQYYDVLSISDNDSTLVLNQDYYIDANNRGVYLLSDVHEAHNIVIQYTAHIYQYTFNVSGATTAAYMYYLDASGNKVRIKNGDTIPVTVESRLGTVYFETVENRDSYADQIVFDETIFAFTETNTYSFETTELKDLSITVHYTNPNCVTANNVNISLTDQNGNETENYMTYQEGCYTVFVVPKNTTVTLTPVNPYFSLSDGYVFDFKNYAASKSVVVGNSGYTINNLFEMRPGVFCGVAIDYITLNYKFIIDNGVDSLTLTGSNDSNVYYENFDVNLSAYDSLSGIESIDYWITDGTDAEGATVYSLLNSEGIAYTEENPCNIVSYNDRSHHSYTGKVTVPVAEGLNDDGNVVVHVVVTDTEGNRSDQNIVYYAYVDTVAPEISINYGDTPAHENGYGEVRTATVTVTYGKEYSYSACNDALYEALRGAIVWEGSEVSDEGLCQIVHLTNPLVHNEAEDTYSVTYTLTFTRNGHHTFNFDKFRSVSGNKAVVNSVDGENAFDFVIQTREPDYADNDFELQVNGMNGLLQSFQYHFGFYSGEVTVHAVNNNPSNIVDIQLYRVDSVNESDFVNNWESICAQLDEAYKNGEFTTDDITVAGNKTYTVVARVENIGGHFNYFTATGIVLDSNPINITFNNITAPNENGLYNSDVTIDFTAEDVEVNNAVSGLHYVGYKIWVCDSGIDPEQVKFEDIDAEEVAFINIPNTLFNADRPVKGNYSITVDANEYNSNNVVVTIYAEDQSGNPRQETVRLSIDTTAPTITAHYDNNTATNGTYYSANRTLYVDFKERNFDPNDVVFNITNTDGTIPSPSEYTISFGQAANGDDTVHTAAITFSADGDYTFDVSYVDEAGNAASGVSFASGTTNATAFTIDKTVPTATLTYNNNNVANEKYYSAARVGTITVTEHNFQIDLANVTVHAFLNGAEIAAPTVNWSSNGDVHTGLVTFANDGDYTIEVTYSDLAGNEGVAIATQEFTIDTTKAVVNIAGLDNGVSYTSAISPSIDASDINFDSYSITLTRSRSNVYAQDVTSLLNLGDVVASETGFNLRCNNIPGDPANDGIYVLTVTATDLAGNETVETRTVAINRYGSVYAISAYLDELRGGYWQEITEDIVISEYNASDLQAGSYNVEITRDGQPIDADYEVVPGNNSLVADGQHGWYQYDYIIDRGNFTTDAVYKITISSSDKAGHNTDSSFSEDASEIVFYLDTTAPTITSSMDSDALVDEDGNVSFSIFDAMGIESVDVLVDGESVFNCVDFEDANNYSTTVAIEDYDADMEVQIVAVDHAQNSSSVTNVEDAGTPAGSNITNPDNDTNRTPLFVGIGIGLGCLAAAGAVVIIVNRKKTKVTNK